MGIRALVFDFGNVVAFFSHKRASERLAQHAAVDADALHRFLFGDELVDGYDSGQLSTAEFIERVRQGCGLGCDDDTFAEAYGDIFSPNAELCALLPGLSERYPLLLLSNTNELHARRFLRQFAEQLRVFRHVVLSHEVGVRKPHPGIFEHAQKQAGCRAEELLFVDDLPANVEGARACGWQGVVYTGVEELRRQLAALNVCVAA
jgi:putative hydrolase of the HAD superfamily